MTSTLTRMVGVALVTLAIATPATAMPLSDGGAPTSSPAGTTSEPRQDLRNPDQQAPAPITRQDLRNPDNRAPGVPSDLPQTMKPVVRTEPQPVADDGGLSPFVFIAPSVVLVVLLGGATALIYTRSSRPARV